MKTLLIDIRLEEVLETSQSFDKFNGHEHIMKAKEFQITIASKNDCKLWGSKLISEQGKAFLVADAKNVVSWRN